MRRKCGHLRPHATVAVPRFVGSLAMLTFMKKTFGVFKTCILLCHGAVSVHRGLRQRRRAEHEGRLTEQLTLERDPCLPQQHSGGRAELEPLRPGLRQLSILRHGLHAASPRAASLPLSGIHGGPVVVRLRADKRPRRLAVGVIIRRHTLHMATCSGNVTHAVRWTVTLLGKLPSSVG